MNYLKIESDSEFEIYDRIFGMRNIPPPVTPKKKNLKNKYKYGSKGSAFTENETAEVYYEDFTDMVIAKMEALECAEYEVSSLHGHFCNHSTNLFLSVYIQLKVIFGVASRISLWDINCT